MRGITGAMTTGGPGFDVALTSWGPETRRGVSRWTPLIVASSAADPYIRYGTPLAARPGMANNQTATMTVEEQGNSIDAPDILCLLNDLNIDALIASLENDLEPQSATEHAAIANDPRSPRRFTPTELAADLKVTMPNVTDLVVLDISETGILIETRTRLNPGTPGDIVVFLNGKRNLTRATVIRSNLHAIKSGVVYRAALRFEKGLPIEARP